MTDKEIQHIIGVSYEVIACGNHPEEKKIRADTERLKKKLEKK